jgi:hypothetical protein
MYFFYFDESGSRDPRASVALPDGSHQPKDHVYVLTALSLYEHKWRQFDREIANLKLDQDFKYAYFRELLPHFYKREKGEQLDGLKVFPNDSELIPFSREGWIEFKTEQPTLWSRLKKT